MEQKQQEEVFFQVLILNWRERRMEISRVRGKGYGHGVGNESDRADKMAEQGYDYREILDYFFRNITVENLG